MKRTIILGISIITFAACSSTKETAPVAKESKVEEAVTYTNTIKSLVNKKCVGCHKGYGAAGDLSLESYEAVKNSAEKGTLLKRINDAEKPMPKAGLMSEKHRALFQKWADNNFAK